MSIKTNTTKISIYEKPLKCVIGFAVISVLIWSKISENDRSLLNFFSDGLNISYLVVDIVELSVMKGST